MKGFAKIYHLPEYDVLVVKKFDGEQERAPYVIEVSVEMEPGLYVHMDHHYISEEKRDLMFEHLDEDTAQSNLAIIIGNYQRALAADTPPTDGDVLAVIKPLDGE